MPQQGHLRSELYHCRNDHPTSNLHIDINTTDMDQKPACEETFLSQPPNKYSTTSSNQPLSTTPPRLNRLPIYYSQPQTTTQSPYCYHHPRATNTHASPINLTISPTLPATSLHPISIPTSLLRKFLFKSLPQQALCLQIYFPPAMDGSRLLSPVGNHPTF